MTRATALFTWRLGRRHIYRTFTSRNCSLRRFAPKREFFSTAAPPHRAGLPGKLAGELKICLETQLADVNHIGCWDSSYLQIGLQSWPANQIQGG